MRCLNIDNIAAKLESFEETIIFKLVDRVQYLANLRIYTKGTSGFEGEINESLLSLRLRYQEQMDALFGRFKVPEERPFTDNLPNPRREVKIPNTGLALDNYNIVNVTAQILESYIKLVPKMCEAGDDGQYGSSVEHDVYALQAISRRIHYGALYIAESKFRSDPKKYKSLIAAADEDGLLKILTRKNVEDAIIRRVKEKAELLQQRINPVVRKRIAPHIVEFYYREYIIPLTKKGEILYLLNRKTHKAI